MTEITPATKFPLQITMADAELLMTLMVKQTVAPGEAWMNLFFLIRQQRDQFIAANQPAAEQPPTPPPET